jgi:hypothetical protein
MVATLIEAFGNFNNINNKFEDNLPAGCVKYDDEKS